MVLFDLKQFMALKSHFAVIPVLLAVLFQCGTVEVKALDAARSFREKAKILHLYAYWPQGKTVTSRQSRFYYDLFRQIQYSIMLNPDLSIR